MTSTHGGPPLDNDTARLIANVLATVAEAAKRNRIGWIAPSEEWWVDGQPMTEPGQIVTEAMCRARLLAHCPRCTPIEREPILGRAACPAPTQTPDAQMAEAVRRQLDHVDASRRVDRRGWTRQQWIDDARRLLGDLDGSVLDLLNGHVTAMLEALDELQANAQSDGAA